MGFVLLLSETPPEPDSLPNLVTNAKLDTCQKSKQGYEDGVAYALKSLGALPNVVQ